MAASKAGRKTLTFVTGNPQEAGRGEIYMHKPAEGHKTTATSKEKEVKLKHRMLVSTPDQRTGPFRINVLILTQCSFTARGISAHFAYTSFILCVALCISCIWRLHAAKLHHVC